MNSKIQCLMNVFIYILIYGQIIIINNHTLILWYFSWILILNKINKTILGCDMIEEAKTGDNIEVWLKEVCKIFSLNFLQHVYDYWS